MGYQTSKKLIREFCQEYPVTGFLDCIQYLEKVYSFVKDNRENYSYIQFASDLGFSGTNVLHQILRGYRKLTLKTAKKLTTAMHLKGVQKRYFETLVEYRNEISSIKRDEIFAHLIELKRETLKSEDDQKWLEFFSTWYHPIVLETLQLDNCKNNPGKIASRINPPIKTKQAEESIQLLLDLKLIELDSESQIFHPVKSSISSGHEVTGIGFIRYHQRMIELAKESITRVESSQRDISSVTFSCDEDSVAEVKQMIHEFNEKLQKKLESVESKKKVVQLNIQLFPVTSENE